MQFMQRSAHHLIKHAQIKRCELGRCVGVRLLSIRCMSGDADMSARVTRRVSPLVTTQWLDTNLRQNYPNLRVLDGSWHLPISKRNAIREFHDSHIPGALFFSIDDCSVKSSELEHMLPSPEVFENYVSKLGIDNNTHVVVYDNSPNFGLFSAQRVWWMFRTFGHNLVSVLDGGFPKWTNENRETTDEVTVIPSDSFRFKAAYNPAFVKSYEQVENNITGAKNFTVLDARPSGRFEGTSPEPRPGIKPGHIPGSVNIPFPSVLNAESKTLKSAAELRQVFEQAGVDLSQPLAASCGSGISGCLLVLAAHVCGKDDVSLYDGSWTEWYMRAPHNLKVFAK